MNSQTLLVVIMGMLVVTVSLLAFLKSKKKPTAPPIAEEAKIDLFIYPDSIQAVIERFCQKICHSSCCNNSAAEVHYSSPKKGLQITFHCCGAIFQEVGELQDFNLSICQHCHSHTTSKAESIYMRFADVRCTKKPDVHVISFKIIKNTQKKVLDIKENDNGNPVWHRDNIQ